jgi:hypothetical protein
MHLTPANPVGYHQQDDPAFCGEAVAQMLLAALNGTDPTRQIDLRKNLGAQADPPFATAPAALADGLTNLQTAPAIRFDPHFDAHPIDSVRRIVASLQSVKTALPVMVFEKLHWVLVCNALLKSVSGSSDEFRGFFVNDPWPVTAKNAFPHEPNLPPSPFPHANGDACGNNAGNLIFGFAETFISAEGWFACYATKPATIGGQSGFVSVAPSVAGIPAVRRPSTPAAAPITTDSAHKAVQEDQLDQQGPLKDSLAGATFTKVLPSVSIIDPSLPATAYTGVVYSRPPVVTAGVALFGARGDLWGVRAYGPATPPSAGFLTEDEVKAALQRERTGITERFGSRRFASMMERVEYRLVWRPSLASRSPFLPLARIENVPPDEPLYVTPFGKVLHEELV